MGLTDGAVWASLAVLGAYHGLNPGMGWLFAVALGLQERKRAAVARALAPIAAGHAASVALAVAAVAALHVWLDLNALKTLGAAALVAFGVYKLVAPLSHPRWVGMRVSGRDLVAWSFLMSTAHGAGLMLVPLVLRLPVSSVGGGEHVAHAAPLALPMGPETAALGVPGLPEALAIGIHTVAMFSVMALVAIVVFEKVGLAVLRRAWLNVDRLWAGALIAAAWVTLLA